MSVILPTVGRSLHYIPHQDDAKEFPCSFAEPLACILAGVQSDKIVNLCVFDSNGNPHAMTSVPLVQDGEPAPAEGGYAQWMPYQVGQAKSISNIAESSALIKDIAKL